MTTALLNETTACRVPAETVVLDNLSRRSRAYNALYGMGEATPETVATLTDAETEEILLIAHQAAMGVTTTERHRKMAALSPSLLRYIAVGGLA